MHNTKYMNTYHHAKQHILYIQFPPQNLKMKVLVKIKKIYQLPHRILELMDHKKRDMMYIPPAMMI